MKISIETEPGEVAELLKLALDAKVTANSAMYSAIADTIQSIAAAMATPTGKQEAPAPRTDAGA